MINKFKKRILIDEDVSNVRVNVEQIKDITYQTKLIDNDPFYVRDGKGYRATIEIYDTPIEVPYQWLQYFGADDNVYVSIDIVPNDLHEIKGTMQKAVRELQHRVNHSKDEFEQIEADNSLQELVELIRELTAGKERILSFNICLYVYAHTLEDLDKKTGSIILELQERDFEAAIFPNEQLEAEKNKYRSLEKSSNVLRGENKTEVTTETMSAGYPFNYHDLQDPTGAYWGLNEIGANMFFDMFTNDGKKRISYNLIILGLMGAGKSATIQKIIIQNVGAGNRVRISDVTGEHEQVTHALGGKVLYLDGQNFTINPHMIKLVKYKEKYSKTDLKQILNETVASARRTLEIFDNDLTKKHLNLYGQIVYWLYQQKGAEDKLLTIQDEIIYSDVLAVIKEQKEKIKDDVTYAVKFQYLQELELTIESLVEGEYADYLNKRSTYNFYEEQVVTFVLRPVTQDKSKLVVFQYLINQIIWNEMLYFGAPQKELYALGLLSHEDAVKYLYISDEAHYQLNATQTIVLSDFVELLREARKYFMGTVLGSHSLKDFLPDDASKEGTRLLSTMFELMQYRIIMQQDLSGRQKIREAFGEQFKEYQIKNIHKFEKGQALLNISGYQTQMINIHLSNIEKAFLNGGV